MEPVCPTCKSNDPAYSNLRECGPSHYAMPCSDNWHRPAAPKVAPLKPFNIVDDRSTDAEDWLMPDYHPSDPRFKKEAAPPKVEPEPICAEPRCGHIEASHFRAEMGSFCRECRIEGNVWEHPFRPAAPKREPLGTCEASTFPHAIGHGGKLAGHQDNGCRGWEAALPDPKPSVRNDGKHGCTEHFPNFNYGCYWCSMLFRQSKTVSNVGAAKPVALFQLGNFHLHSGEESPFKIECDALTDADWECLAYLLAARLQSFGSVEGVPEGGMKLAAKMTKYVSTGPLLIVDDVYTTGDSMQRQRADRDAIGAVIFARNRPLGWITALFELGAKPVVAGSSR